MSHCEWRPLDTAPKDGRYFYVSSKKLHTPFLARWDDLKGKWMLFIAEGAKFKNPDAYQCTHWMPLPPPPEG